MTVGTTTANVGKSAATAYPLQWPAGWPRTKTRVDSRYKVKPASALSELFEELERMEAKNIVVSSMAPVRKSDGRPYADALTDKHEDPGVAVYFMHAGEPVVIACDKWTRLWENVRAVGLTVEGMRQIQRSGASELLRRAFAGFKEIGGPVDGEAPWWDVLGVPSDASEEEAQRAFLEKAKLAHPDRGGSSDDMARLNRARSSMLLSIGGVS